MPRSDYLLSFGELRTLADALPLLRSVVETRKDQIAALNWTVRSRLTGARPGAAQRSAAVRDFFTFPDRQHDFSTCLRMLVEDMLVIDAATLYQSRTLYPYSNSTPPRPLTRRTLMSQEPRMSLAATTQETLDLMKASLAKNVTISTGLTAYDLQAPAKNLYPVITPLRNSLPRVQRQFPGDAARWRTIFSITGSGFDAMGWVPEGQRTASMSYTATPMVAPYVTLGEEDTVTFEAEAAAQGFEDVNSTATLRLLQKTMRKEETALLGGNVSVALGTPTSPVLSPPPPPARRCPAPPIR